MGRARTGITSSDSRDSGFVGEATASESSACNWDNSRAMVSASNRSTAYSSVPEKPRASSRINIVRSASDVPYCAGSSVTS
ncbi:hypothetical protein COSO111634_34445 [Corallococcus soli]